jgi:hypothetical protein
MRDIKELNNVLDGDKACDDDVRDIVEVTDGWDQCHVEVIAIFDGQCPDASKHLGPVVLWNRDRLFVGASILLKKPDSPGSACCSKECTRYSALKCGLDDPCINCLFNGREKQPGTFGQDKADYERMLKENVERCKADLVDNPEKCNDWAVSRGVNDNPFSKTPDRCCNCGSDDLDYMRHEIYDELVEMPYTCKTCEFQGSEWHKLVFVENVETS